MFNYKGATRADAVMMAIIILGLIIILACACTVATRKNINTCSKIDLLEIDGIGCMTADDIIRHRPYHSLKEVKYNCDTVGEVRYKSLIRHNFIAE